MSVEATIGFSTTNLWISKFIRWFTGSPVSHAWIAYNDVERGERVVLQAETRCIELKPWKEWVKENILVAEFDLIGPNVDESVDWAVHNFVGQRYDWINAGLAGLWKWLGRWIISRGSNPKRLMCSELVLRTLQKAGYSSLEHFNPEVTNPYRLLIRVMEMALIFKEEFEQIYINERLFELSLGLISKARNKNG